MADIWNKIHVWEKIEQKAVCQM